jgi:hypothetical protein
MTKQQRKRSLAYTFNVGIVNSSYRNGFAYPVHQLDGGTDFP